MSIIVVGTFHDVFVMFGQCFNTLLMMIWWCFGNESMMCWFGDVFVMFW